jgi:hypothetical protein
MLDTFNRSLDRGLPSIGLTDAAQQSVSDQRIKLAAITISNEIAPEKRDALKTIIDRSFVKGFRCVMLIGALLALASGLTSFALIDSRPRLRQT